MPISSVPNNLLKDWMDSVATSNQTTPEVDSESFIPVATMTDAQKVTSLTSYLNSRIASDQAQISALNASITSQTNALNADIAACQAAIASL